MSRFLYRSHEHIVALYVNEKKNQIQPHTNIQLKSMGKALGKSVPNQNEYKLVEKQV